MDSSDWFQGMNEEDSSGKDSSSSPFGDMVTRSKPVMEKPQHEQALNCPRCDSTHTKFCYYNNYSLSQPRYFCKTCKRYWTKGGTLRNIPVGGGCRKNKRVSIKKASETHQTINQNSSSSPSSFHDDQVIYSHPSKFLENPIDFMGNYDMGMVGFGEMDNGFGSNYGFYSPFGISLDGYQRLMHQYGGNDDHSSAIEMKPNGKLLSLDWQDQSNINSLGSWNGMINGYDASTTNQLV